MKKSHTTIAALVAAIAVASMLGNATTAEGADSITENFDGSTLTPLLQIPTNYVFGPSADPTGTIYRVSGDRDYVTTVATDYNTVDFVYDLSFTLNGGSGVGLAWMGIGSAQPTPGFFFEPNTSAYMRAWPYDNGSGSVILGVSPSTSIYHTETNFGSPPADSQTARARIAKIGDTVTFSYQTAYAGGAYTPTYTISKSLSADLSFLNSTNSRLFFGTDLPSRIDNLKITTALTSGPQAPNLVQNPSFETPTVANGTFVTIPGGGSIGPWAVGGAGVDLNTSSYISSADGSQCVDLTGSPGAGSVSQTLNTLNGQFYTLTFAMAGNAFLAPDFPSPAVKQIQVAWNGQVVASPTFDTTGHTLSNPGWKNLTYVLKATADSTALTFTSLTPGATGPLLDNVRVTQMPGLTAQVTTQLPGTQLTSLPKQTSGLVVFDGTQFVSGGVVDPNKPTIVLTHGMYGDPGKSNDWTAQMAGLLSQNDQKSVNIVAWDWHQDANSVYAVSRAPNEGIALGDALVASLGSNYSLPLHFIGHSAGTIVNARAIDTFRSSDLSNGAIQDTLFDDAGIAGSCSAIPGSKVAWIDNYLTEVGSFHDEAVNVILTKGGTNLVAEHGYPCQYYGLTIPIASRTVSSMGFRYDITQDTLSGHPVVGVDNYIQNSAPGDNELALTWATAQQAKDALGQNNGGQLFGTNSSYVTSPSVNGPVLTQGHVTVDLEPVDQFDPTTGLSSTVLTPKITLIKHSPSYAWLPLIIPADAQTMTLDFAFSGIDPDDFMTVGINDSLLFALEGRFVTDGTVNSTGVLDVSQWAGQDVTLFLGLNSSGGTAGGTMTIDALQFQEVPEPTSLALLGMGIAAFLIRRR